MLKSLRHIKKENCLNGEITLKEKDTFLLKKTERILTIIV